MNLSDYAEDIKELKHRVKIAGITLLCSVLFFFVAPASLNENLLGFYKPFISVLLDAIRTYLLPSNVSLIPGTPSAPITIYTFAALFFGFLVASPMIFYQAWKFIRPAFDEVPTRIIWSSIILFLIGCLFGFFIMMPAVIYGLFAFFPYVGVTQNIIAAQDFYQMVFIVTLISGLSFLTPIGVYLASRLGFDPKTVTKKRKYLWGIVYVVSAIITPDSNILADFVMFIPLIMMIEVSLWIASRKTKLRPNSVSKYVSLDVAYCDTRRRDSEALIHKYIRQLPR